MRDRDDELCLCFHVTRRKVENFLRVERPRRVSQISECFGAGTGCGWCRPFLQKLFDAYAAGEDAEFPDAAAYAAQRADYRQKKKDDERSAVEPPEAVPDAASDENPGRTGG
jgi:NAD(P)H-nitrite reductase large subunit